jgi:hypothetical protein
LNSLPKTSRLMKLLKKSNSNLPLLGELWMGSSFLEKAGFTDTVENHFAIAQRLGHQLVCLPVAEERHFAQTLGYWYFQPADIPKKFQESTQCLGVVVDGPFQRLVGRLGLMEVLVMWGTDREQLNKEYMAEQEKALCLVEQCLEKDVDAVILADDLAGDQQPLIDPIELERVCTPFYDKVVSLIHDRGRPALLHCCGNLTEFISIFNSWKLDGLAAIQTSKNDIDLLDSHFNGILMTGIEADLLEKESPTAGEFDKLKSLVRRLASQKRLVLCTSAGLYSGYFWGRLQNIYKTLEEAV